MVYLDYNRFREIVDDYFECSHDAPDTSRQQVNREYGYIDVTRFFGDDAVDPGNIAVERRETPFNFKDDWIAAFAAEMEASLSADGRLHAGPAVMKLVAADLRSPRPSITVQPCRYGLQAGNCFALDYRHPSFEKYGGSLRDYYLLKYPSRSVEDNPLAICLGVAACVVVGPAENRELLVVHRSARMASLESSFGPSVAGSVDYPTVGDNLASLMRNAIAAEAAEELRLAPAEYEFIPLAYAREIFRGERPQLFGALLTNLTRPELIARLEKLDPETREFDRYEFLRLDNSGFHPNPLVEQVNFEGRMNLELLREYFGQYG